MKIEMTNGNQKGTDVKDSEAIRRYFARDYSSC